MSDNRFLNYDFKKAEYNSLVAVINKTYCLKHNYDFVYYRSYLDDAKSVNLDNNKDPITGKPRHAAWCKIQSAYLALYEALQSKTYDYIVYIDSDCIFKNFNKSLEEFIEPYSNDILISNDYPFNKMKACTGFFVCKVNNNSLNFLKDWFNYDFKGRPNPSYWEQGALWLLYEEGKYDIKLFHNEDYFNDRPDQYLRHVATFVSINLAENSEKKDDKNREKVGRNNYFKFFIEDRQIDYISTVNNITVVDYNTNSVFFRNTLYGTNILHFERTILKIILLIAFIGLVHFYTKTLVRNKRYAIILEIILISISLLIAFKDQLRLF
jgi:hypothetical protein